MIEPRVQVPTFWLFRRIQLRGQFAQRLPGPRRGRARDCALLGSKEGL